jgi:hypothetical protein
VCPAGFSFTGGVDGKPSIELLALVRCVECHLWYAWNIVYGIHGILLVETVIIYKCVMNRVTCTR